MTEYAYCKSWFWADRMTNNPISEAEARRRHERRELYTVAVGGFDHPSAVIEMFRAALAVTFLDRLQRRGLDYEFHELKPLRLFLSMAVRRVYCPATGEMVARMEAGRKQPDQPWAQFLADADRVLDGRSVKFDVDGATFYGASRHGDARKLVMSGPRWDVSGFWLPYPEFGQYDHLLEARPEIPWGPGLDGP